MNKYPTWWNQTITVYNKFEDANRKIYWYSTVLENCFWKYEHEKVIVGETALVTDSTKCRIPKNENFIEKYLWNELEDKSTKFTVGPGDIIILGEATDEVNEYVAGHRSTDLLNKYKKLQGAILVEEVTINVGGGRHNEHYHIRGV